MKSPRCPPPTLGAPGALGDKSARPKTEIAFHGSFQDKLYATFCLFGLISEVCFSFLGLYLDRSIER